jgi:Tol biopolymer transport system component
MLTKGGIKLLDFGLSRECVKATDSEQPPSVSLDMTSPGHLLGTIQYMSPEQTEGRVADARSDIFAFGAVLYEMMAGQRAFQGDTHSKLATAIREHEPPLLAAIPPSLDRVVRTCLAKDPDERWQTARDLLRELQWIANGLRDVTDPRTGASRHLRLVASSFIIMTIVMAGALAWLRYGSVNWGEAEHPPVRFEVATPATSDPMSFALSPDGRQLAFVAMDNYSSKLWIRRIDQIDARSLRGTDGAIYPFWSPDSHTVAYFARGKLNTVDLRNESHRVLADAPNGRGGTWNTDGVIVFAPETAGPLMRVFANGGTSVPATRLIDGEHNHRWPQFLPDGRHFLFLSTQGRQTTIGVFVGSLMGGDTIRVLDDESPAAYAAGSLLVVRRGTLLAYPFDADHAKVIGEPNTVAQPIGFDTASSRSAFSVSENGAVAFRTGIADRRQLVWLTRDGTPDGSVGPPDDSAIAAPELTRDGQKLAVHRTVESNDDVWTMNVQNGVPSRFTSEAGGDLFPIWSPDGKQIVFVSNRNRSYGLFERPSDGSREERQVLASELKVPTDFSPDGTTLLYAIPVSKRGDVDIWAQRIDGSASPIPVAHSKFDEMAGQFSPDGRLVAYQSNASGRMEIYLTEFPTSSVHEQVSTSGGSQPRWRPDGRELFYIAPDGQMTAAGVQPGSLDTGRTVALFQTRLATGANIPSASGTKQQYAVSRDGRFLMNISVAPPPPITLLLNWHTAVNTSAER